MSENLCTSLGSPCSPAWDGAWIGVVEAAEHEAGRRVCGARTLDGTPCTLVPGHENGRCRYHGGFALTGAQPGNRNGVIHGLYARGLQRCGEHCPQWGWCPLTNVGGDAAAGASEDLAGLAPRQRPACPYEAAQFQTALSDLLAALPGDAGSHLPQLVHQVALQQVMMQRAAAAMGVTSLTEETHVESGTYRMDSAKPAAALAAYTRLAAEHRRGLGLLLKALDQEHRNGALGLSDVEVRRRAVDTEVTPEAQAELDPAHDECVARARGLIGDAEWKIDKRNKDREHLARVEASNIEEEKALDELGSFGESGAQRSPFSPLSFFTHQEEEEEEEVEEGAPSSVDEEEVDPVRTENGFVEEETESKFQYIAVPLKNEAFTLYWRAFRLAPQLYAPYTSDAAKASYLGLFNDADLNALAPP